MTCPECSHETKRLTMSTTGEFVCFDCVPQEVWAAYPGSYERAVLRQNRAAQARKNFGHQQEARV